MPQGEWPGPPHGARIQPVFDANEKWLAQGKVLKNGEPYGNYAIDVEKIGVTCRRQYQGNLRIVIKTKDKEFEVQSFRGN